MSRSGKIGGVIISHGQIANELLAAAEAVVGELNHVSAVSIGWHDDVELAKDEIQRAIAKVSDGEGVLLLTDMFGGTPTNIAAVFLERNKVEIVTGVNLPMIIKFANGDSGLSLEELAKEVEAQGRDAIRRSATLLEPVGLKKDA